MSMDKVCNKALCFKWMHESPFEEEQEIMLEIWLISHLLRVCVPFRHFERSAHEADQCFTMSNKKRSCCYVHSPLSIHSFNKWFFLFMSIILLCFALRWLWLLWVLSVDHSLFSGLYDLYKFSHIVLHSLLSRFKCFMCLCVCVALLWFIQY